ncbi:MAG: hypothetical protein CVU91_08790 [Firmicutes bacterium HGW-Firmicutes-16]|nr:MAG: hypothetical protein CVU91_08790 [Firmicutes bacterium HGW-Firmicutes-16]
MDTYLIDYEGSSYRLPVLLEWKFSYGCALPCDAFEITFIFNKSMLDMLSNAVRLRAEQKGETVFLGVVDDFEISVTENGCIVTVNGRGLAALLLDNEAEAAQYYSASLDMILEKYVYPYGIRDVRKNVSPPQQALVVDSGASLWKVLENFVWFGCGVKPRFTKDGVLLIGEEKGQSFISSENSAFTKQVLKRSRYGVISEVLVKNKALGMTETVENTRFTEQGGCCRRIVNVPRKTRYDAMRSTGEYQIAQSKAKELTVTLTVPSVRFFRVTRLS